MAGAYPGGFITKSPTATVGSTDTGFGPEGGSASGMWTLDQALVLKSSGLWPTRSKDKFLWGWGNNAEGRLGDDTVINRSSPVQIGALATWSQITNGGNQHTGAIKTDGTMWTFGYNGRGFLGLNDRVSRSSPVQVGALTTWSRVAAGTATSMAIKTDGTLWIWGANFHGRLGLNIDTSIYRSSPVQIGSLSTWSKISSDNGQCAAIKTDGTLWLWGRNDNGKLGDNTEENRSSPVQIGAGTTWSLVAAGSYACMAIKTDGTMWAWGKNQRGNLGLNDTIYRSSPVQVGALTSWSKVAPSESTCVALKTDGTMWTWGNAQSGALGHNIAYQFKSSPIQVGTLTDWSQIATCGQSVMAIKTDGTLWAWGTNGQGQHGDSTQGINKSSPVQIGSNTNWAKIASGGSQGTHYIAIAAV